MNPKSSSHFKVVIEIEPNFDFSPVEDKEYLYSRSVRLVNEFIAGVAENSEALEQIFVSDTLECLLENGKFIFPKEDIMQIGERYPKSYNDVFLQLADAYGNNGNNEAKNFIYALFSPEHYGFLSESVRKTYFDFFFDRFLKKKISVSLVVEDEKPLQPETRPDSIE